MKACAHLQQADNAASNRGPPTARRRHPTQNFQQSAFAGPVPADDSGDLAGPRLQADILQRPESVALITVAAEFLHALEWRPDRLGDEIVESVRPALSLPD